jgi:hypothetical protein
LVTCTQDMSRVHVTTRTSIDLGNSQLRLHRILVIDDVTCNPYLISSDAVEIWLLVMADKSNK